MVPGRSRTYRRTRYSGFSREINENCALLGYYACVLVISYRQVPETSVRNYHYWLHNNSEERSSHTEVCLNGLLIAHTAVLNLKNVGLYPVCVVLWPWEITQCGPWPRGQNTAAAQPCVYEPNAVAVIRMVHDKTRSRQSSGTVLYVWLSLKWYVYRQL